MEGSVLKVKSSLKMLELSFSSNLDRGSYIASIGKTTSQKIGALIRSLKFLSSDVFLYRNSLTKYSPKNEYYSQFTFFVHMDIIVIINVTFLK